MYIAGYTITVILLHEIHFPNNLKDFLKVILIKQNVSVRIYRHQESVYESQQW